MVSITIPRGEELSEARKLQLIEDLANSPVRKLTKEERDLYGHAIIKAVECIPAFRDALALMRPYMDATAPTAYTDPHARVGLGYWFFYILNRQQRASVLLHECMHVLNNHFQRREEMSSLRSNPLLFNLAGDFEINTVLNGVRFVDLSEGQLPDRAPNNYPPFKTMEYYADLLAQDAKKAKENCEACKQEKQDKEDKKNKSEDTSKEPPSEDKSDSSGEEEGEGESEGEEASEDGSGDSEEGDSKGEGQSESGNGKSHSCGKESGEGEGEGEGSGEGSGKAGQGKSWGCGNSDEKTEAAADEAGIQRASNVEVTIAKQNTAARIVDEKNSGGRGTGANDAFWDSILKHLKPPVVDWRKVFRRIVASSVDSLVKGRSDYTYRRVSRRLQSRDFVFPGMLSYLPKITLAIDTSGSMGDEDFQKALIEIEGILKEVARGKESVSIFSVDTKAGNISPVSSIKKVRLTGGGGTIMAVAWQYVKSLPKVNHPDILILATDGYIDWDDVEKEIRSSKFKSVICVTQKGGFASAPASLKRHTPVLDISRDS